MFESQINSLASLTFLVQLIGLIMIISYRMRSSACRFNQAGMLFGILLIAASSIGCLIADSSTGITQGVMLVVVAVGATLDLGCSQRHKDWI